MIPFTQSYFQTTPEALEEFEKKWNILFPEDYKTFLLQQNGGKPEVTIFPITNNPSGNKGIITDFFGINTYDSNDLNSVFETYKSTHRLPQSYFPIAQDPGGNLICLSYGGENVGKVFFWDHEGEYEEGEQPGYRNMYLIADTLPQFLDSLTRDNQK